MFWDTFVSLLSIEVFTIVKVIVNKSSDADLNTWIYARVLGTHFNWYLLIVGSFSIGDMPMKRVHKLLRLADLSLRFVAMELVSCSVFAWNILLKNVWVFILIAYWFLCNPITSGWTLKFITASTRLILPLPFVLRLVIYSRTGIESIYVFSVSSHD